MDSLTQYQQLRSINYCRYPLNISRRNMKDPLNISRRNIQNSSGHHIVSTNNISNDKSKLIHFMVKK